MIQQTWDLQGMGIHPSGHRTYQGCECPDSQTSNLRYLPRLPYPSVNRMTDRRLWKHYPLDFNITSAFRTKLKKFCCLPLGRQVHGYHNIGVQEFLCSQSWGMTFPRYVLAAFFGATGYSIYDRHRTKPHVEYQEDISGIYKNRSHFYMTYLNYRPTTASW